MAPWRGSSEAGPAHQTPDFGFPVLLLAQLGKETAIPPVEVAREQRVETLYPGVARRIKLAVGIGFTLVLVVGGLSVLMTWMIARELEQASHRGRETEEIDQIDALLDSFVSDLYLAVSGIQARSGRSPDETLERLNRRIAAYEAQERTERKHEARQELIQLEHLKSLLAELKTSSVKTAEKSARSRPPGPAELAVVNELVYHRASGIFEQLRSLHHRKFQRLIQEGYERLLLISVLYAGFAVCGALLLFLGNRFLFSSLVLPISRLAQAAVDISGGDLSQRVPVRSDDEVGQLSRSFNLMADQLEAHETQRLTFQSELERQVRERTRELEEATVSLQAAQARLIRAERIAVTGQIAAGVTHEIRTPLNSLGINVQLLRRDLSRGSPPPFREVVNTLATVDYEITRINRILDEFVSFARLPEPRFGQVAVGTLIRELLKFLEAQAAEAGVHIEAPSTSSAARVRGDRDQLRQVFLNLAQNALQAMPNGGALAVEVVEDGRCVEITLTDSGPGIPKEERERVFLPFVSAKPGGLGLGLAIVRRIVEEHGGSVFCGQRNGGGAAFVVRLPVADSLSER
jgi:signal transduction histidine kinase